MNDASPDAEIIEPQQTVAAPGWETLPMGEYAIVELFGHTTLVGRITEVERFGAKMMALEPIFNKHLLGPVYHGGAAIYRLTPCSPQIAWDRQHKESWSLPPSIRVVVPPEALPAPEAPRSVFEHDDVTRDC